MVESQSLIDAAKSIRSELERNARKSISDLHHEINSRLQNGTKDLPKLVTQNEDESILAFPGTPVKAAIKIYADGNMIKTSSPFGFEIKDQEIKDGLFIPLALEVLTYFEPKVEKPLEESPSKPNGFKGLLEEYVSKVKKSPTNQTS